MSVTTEQHAIGELAGDEDGEGGGGDGEGGGGDGEGGGGVAASCERTSESISRRVRVHRGVNAGVNRADLRAVDLSCKAVI